MKKKFFISCSHPKGKLGIIQIACHTREEAVKASMEMCPQRGAFRLYELEEFDSNMAVGIFVPYAVCKELGY